MLELRQVSYQVGQKTIVKPISFKIAPGEVLAILGPNGAGKSTVLSLMSAALQPVSGQVVIDNFDINQLSASERAKRCALLTQHQAVEISLTVLEVVLLGRYPYRSSNTLLENEDVAKEALMRVGADSLLDRMYMSLSGGEQQKVQLARVLAQVALGQNAKPSYLLLDEHIAHMDVKYQYHTFKTLRSLCSENLAVVVIVHDFNIASRFADRVLLLNQGVMEVCDQVDLALTQENISRVFGVQVAEIKHGAHRLFCPA